MSEPVVTMKQLLEAGVHFGHQTRRWNPKMKRFIFGDRNGIYIIDLQQTLKRIETAYTVRPRHRRRRRHRPLRRHQEAGPGPDPVLRREVRHAVHQRALARRHAHQLRDHVQARRQDAGVPPHARLRRVRGHAQEGSPPDHPRARASSSATSAASPRWSSCPTLVFILDTKKEHIAVTEANKLGIPIVAVVDTNCDPDVIQYVIPGNDDAIRSGTLMCRVIADAVEEGRLIASQAAGGADRRRRQGPHRRGGGRHRRPAGRGPPPGRRGRRRARGPHRRAAGRPAARRRGRRDPARPPPRPLPPRPLPPEAPARRGRAADTTEETAHRCLTSPPRTSRPCASPPAPG